MKKCDVDNMTMQEAMDYAVRSIVRQGGRCANEDHECVYGNGEGRHCAIGWLLDETDGELMEFGGAVETLVHQFGKTERVPDVISRNLPAFDALQRLHDGRWQRERAIRAEILRDNYDVDVSGGHWDAWIRMGEA